MQSRGRQDVADDVVGRVYNLNLNFKIKDTSAVGILLLLIRTCWKLEWLREIVQPLPGASKLLCMFWHEVCNNYY